ncbi:MAG TPA: cation-transporting P-type ATPase, partial [Candidatus Acidoferrum sp.]|nr:cation-transporting P-type ATPase [Candidatus Acidoferrum sp.]
MISNLSRFLNISDRKVLQELDTKATGLSHLEVERRQKQYGLNTVQSRELNAWKILYRQATGNPLVIILAVATAISYLLGQHTSAYYIFGIILLSISLGFWN